MKKLTGDWVRKAEVDLRVSKTLARSRPPAHDVVCYHCQQCAEKYLKAILVELGMHVPRTHNLEDLLGLLRPRLPQLTALARGLIFLSRFAVHGRYPGFSARLTQARAARRWATKVRIEARTLLRLPLVRPRRKKP
ncbi:MAG: HEPN domain-containing protein [Planctomycetes bacterium]|nr:HEPN domain-containing protein [Planctomycetota bacterium]